MSTAIPHVLAARRQKIEAQMAAVDPADAQTDDVQIDMSEFVVPANSEQQQKPATRQAAPPPPPSDPVPEADLSFMDDKPTGNDDSRQWEQRYRSLDGMLKARDREISELKRQVETLLANAQAHGDRPATPRGGKVALQLDGLPTVDQKVRDQYSAAVPVIQSVAAELMQRALAPVLDRVAALEAQLGTAVTETQATVRRVQKRTFDAELRAQVPDIRTLVKDRGFRQWAAQRIPYSNETINDRLSAAWEAEDVATIAMLVGDYKAKAKTGAVPAEQQFSAPKLNGASAATEEQAQPEQKQMLAWSKRVDAGNRYRKGTLKKAELDKIAAMYDTAAREGRVDYAA